MINQQTQSSSKSDDAQDMFSCQYDIDELAFQFMRFKEQKTQDDNIQKILTMVESKMYLVNDELLAQESEMKEVQDKFQTITYFFEKIISQQQLTQEKLQQAQIDLIELKNILKNNKLIEMECQEQIFEKLKAVQCFNYSKHLININQLFQEQVQKLEEFCFEIFHKNKEMNEQLNILNSQLTLKQWQRFSFMQQFENYENSLTIQHQGQIIAAQISPDERLIASIDRILQLWNIETRVQVAKFYSQEILNAICFSKSSKFIYLGQNGKLSQLLVTVNQIRLNNQIQAHKKQIDYIMNIKDDIVITSSIDGTLKVVDFKVDDFTQPIILRQIIHNNLDPRNFDYSEQYDFIVGSIRNKLVVWDQLNMNQLMQNDKCYQSKGVIQVQLSPGSNKVLSVSDKEPGIRLLHINFKNLQFDLIQIVFTDIDQIWNISWGNDDDHFVFCECKYYYIINIPKWTQKKVIQENYSNKINLSKQVPSFKYLFSYLDNLIQLLKYQDEVLTLCEGYIIQLMEKEKIRQ